MQTGLGGLAESAIVWHSWFNNDYSAVTAWESALAKAGTEGTDYDSMTGFRGGSLFLPVPSYIIRADADIKAPMFVIQTKMM